MTSSDIKSTYESFFANRDHIKKMSYNKVISFGWILFVSGVCIAVGPGLFMTLTASSSLWTLIVAWIGILFSISGLLIFSTVPPDELNVDTVVDNFKYGYIVHLALVGFLVSYGFIASVLPPYGGFLSLFIMTAFLRNDLQRYHKRHSCKILPDIEKGNDIIASNSIENNHSLLSLHKLNYPPANSHNENFINSEIPQQQPRLSLLHNINLSSFMTKISILILFCFIPFWSICIFIATDIQLFLDNIILIDDIRGTVISFRSLMNRHCPDGITNLFGTLAALYGIAHIYALYYCYYKTILQKKKRSGWTTSMVYGLVYICITALGCGITYFGIFIDTCSLDNWLFGGGPVMTIGLTLIIPDVVVLCLGRKRVFTFMAQQFELKIDRLMEDGAFMAELAASSKTIRVGEFRWIWRVKEDTCCECDTHFVNKRFWMAGKVLEVDEAEGITKVAVDYSDDCDVSAMSYFSGPEVHTSSLSSPLSFRTQTYSEWTQRNFPSKATGDDPVNTLDPVAETVIVSQSIKSCEDSVALLLWAKENLCCYPWPGSENFNDDLLLRSPRELSGDEERERIHALARNVCITTRKDQIDFFISHSWTDDPKEKCIALKKFSSNFKMKYKREPTYWFDKVCIDQKNPGNALLVLPINIGACKKMLVILGKTYISRLWCVWELFTLFSFCNKELAMDRVEVLIIGHDGVLQDRLLELQNFDLGKAHCFDPNEELKLRRIIYDVGLSRFKSCLRQMSVILIAKQKKYF